MSDGKKKFHKELEKQKKKMFYDGRTEVEWLPSPSFKSSSGFAVVFVCFLLLWSLFFCS